MDSRNFHHAAFLKSVVITARVWVFNQYKARPALMLRNKSISRGFPFAASGRHIIPVIG